MNILVTGGAGFIGSHVSHILNDAGHKVSVLDNFSTGKESNIPRGVEILRGDITDSTFLEQLFTSSAFDVVDHHAAQIDVRKSVIDPLFDADVNIVGSLALLEASRKHGVKHFVFASTGGAIYGEQDYFPADELHPTRPESPYGITKRTVELYLEYYRKMYGISYTAFRYANVYGPRQDPHGEAGVVAIFTKSLLENKQTTIYGDGKQTRDYVFVKDLAEAHRKILSQPLSSRIYNIGTGVETSVNELYSLLSNTVKNTFTSATYATKRAGEQMRSVISSAKISEELGWTPETSLKEGLRETVEFFSSTR